MANHTVKIQLRELTVGPVDVEFHVSTEEGKFGLLQISQGGIDWWPRDAKKPYKLTWAQFDSLLKN